MDAKRLSFVALITGVFTICAFVVGINHVSPTMAASGDLIDRVYTDKARYDPGDVATVTVEIDNQTGANWNDTLYLYVDHLETAVYTDTQSLNVSSGVTTTKTFTWTVPTTDFQGYHVEIKAGTTDQNATAIDVSSDWTRYPRYGYLSEFPSSEAQAQSEAKIAALVQSYHINALQFYDWMWKHERMIKRTNGTIDSTWTDWNNRTIAWSTLQNQITATHNSNVAPMAYVMIYGAREGYEQQSNVNPQWGLYTDAAHSSQWNVDFGDDDPNTYLWFFNPGNTNWQNHIFKEYEDAVLTANFDGVHVDQIGNPGATRYDYWGNTVSLDQTFDDFLNNAKEHLSAVADHNSGYSGQDLLTFNLVGGKVDGWGVANVTQNADTDFDYSEIWSDNPTYNGVRDFVRQARGYNSGKALVLAAYMNYYDPFFTRYEAEGCDTVQCRHQHQSHWLHWFWLRGPVWGIGRLRRVQHYRARGWRLRAGLPLCQRYWQHLHSQRLHWRCG